MLECDHVALHSKPLYISEIIELLRSLPILCAHSPTFVLIEKLSHGDLHPNFSGVCEQNGLKCHHKLIAISSRNALATNITTLIGGFAGSAALLVKTLDGS